ncbi:hypothetical protein M0D44_16505 [Xanthomonas prunicola]|uniref:hypothetical protein n=1 Tax=Xanthomonas prunicola TaxID=2053930 RepID=UPI0021B3B0EA|nr:hypothetical protein [Xanthomonas prunicola]UXA47913.1 hypothetical protein M0D44_16505 [Xanthomonas prunicola]
MHKISEKIEKRLRLRTLRQDLEPLARQLLEFAAAGSRELWGELSQKRLRDDANFRRRFHELAHEGMFAAQEKIADRILSGQPLDLSEQLLFRAIADTMAWGILGGQLCYARRIYKSQKQPSLSHSNFESVLSMARKLREDNPGCMPLISDLTSFVQVGDIINVSADRRISYIEVKEGEHNKHVLDLAMFYEASGCETFREIVEKTESPKTVKQMARVLRQKARLNHVSEIMSKGTAQDPDTGEVIRIPEPFFEVATWEEALADLTEKAKSNMSWAYDVKGPILMGAYAGDSAHRGHLLFLTALSLRGDVEQDYHISRLADCMHVPLAPPVFFRALTDEVKMDLLFGRMNVCIAVSIPRLIETCEMAGMDVRHATRKELGLAKMHRVGPVIHRGKGLIFSLRGKEMMLLEGVIFRALFHGQQPESVLRNHLENIDLNVI